MADPDETISIDVHRRLAVDLYNRAWALLETPDRTEEQDDEMVHTAHASRYHWAQVGNGPRLARGEWQCSWVYSELERAEPALHHARRCEALCHAHEDELEDFDLPVMHEALAKAQLVAGNRQEARRHIDLARRLCAQIEDSEDRELIELQIDSVAAALE